MSNTEAVKQESKQGVERIFSNQTTAVNWFHVAIVAPALAALKYRPEYVIWTPAAGGVIAAVHLLAIAAKRNK